MRDPLGSCLIVSTGSSATGTMIANWAMGAKISGRPSFHGANVIRACELFHHLGPREGTVVTDLRNFLSIFRRRWLYVEGVVWSLLVTAGSAIRSIGTAEAWRVHDAMCVPLPENQPARAECARVGRTLMRLGCSNPALLPYPRPTTRSCRTARTRAVSVRPGRQHRGRRPTQNAGFQESSLSVLLESCHLNGVPVTRWLSAERTALPVMPEVQQEDDNRAMLPYSAGIG